MPATGSRSRDRQNRLLQEEQQYGDATGAPAAAAGVAVRGGRGGPIALGRDSDSVFTGAPGGRGGRGVQDQRVEGVGGRGGGG